MTDKATPKSVKVKLNQAHTHRGQDYKKDEVIEVLPHSASYIEKHKIGSRI
ncbi:hypothetical protein [Zhongshania sp.]|jgi:hypothetical protein|uniref:DUF7210 family protein n=1 Tax=Zhongshania sp. TaxID=1971902 RepID=UPI002A819E7D|nr:hypothetical protein [Zhongshania sp.]